MEYTAAIRGKTMPNCSIIERELLQTPKLGTFKGLSFLKNIQNHRLASLKLMQIFKYLGVGAIVNGVGYALFLLFLLLGIDHKLSASITYLMGALASFLLNRKLVFESVVRLQSGLLRLCIMLLSGYVLNISILYGGVDILGFPAATVQLASIICISIYFYLLNKYFVHRSHNL